MSAHRIHNFNFEHWEGDPPSLPREHVQTFAKAGATGLGQLLLGKRGDTVKARLTSVWASYAIAMLMVPLYQSFIGTASPVDVKYNDIFFTPVFRTRYRVKAVDLVSCQAHVRLIGPGYNLAGGAKLVTEWTLDPVALS